ncbi:MAG TPA: hypothetical protein VGT02_13940 [Methylomirabilota bacterium]|nr:hypothetical protein [Methylomirabilota bacterium]
MSKSTRALVIVGVVVAGLAAVSSIAGARGRSADPRDPERRAALAAMDEALVRQDLQAATQAWRQARELALRSRDWRGPIEAADAELRLAAAADRVREARPTARELFLVALFRARAERSVDGVLRSAEGFARLGDTDAAVLALRIAESTAVKYGDGEERARVRLASERMMRPAADLTHRTQPGS